MVREPACQERCSCWPIGVECSPVTAGSRERSRLVAHAWPGLRSAGLGPRSRRVAGSGFTERRRSRELLASDLGGHAPAVALLACCFAVVAQLSQLTQDVGDLLVLVSVSGRCCTLLLCYSAARLIGPASGPGINLLMRGPG